MDKRKQLLSTALQMFVENGFHGTPTSKIAKNAGVANGTLFHYFKNKENLILELFLELRNDIRATLEKGMKDANTPKQNLKNLYSDSILWAQKNSEAFKYFEMFRASPYFKKFFKKTLKDDTNIYFNLLRNIIDSNDPDKLLLYYTLFMNQIFGINTMLLASKKSKKEKLKTIDDSFDLVWKIFE